MSKIEEDARLVVARVALEKIACLPSFGGKTPEQTAAIQALDTIKRLDAILSEAGER